MSRAAKINGSAFRDPAFMANRTQPVHRWVPWIAGYSRNFVEDALERHMPGPGVVLDPFTGVGTTLVEADLAGHRALGFEINPYAAFAARVKLSAHRLDPDALKFAACGVRDFLAQAERDGRTPHAVPPEFFRTRTAFYSQAVETKVLLLQDYAAQLPEEIAPAFRLAFASQMIAFSNYSYEPSLGRKSSVGRADVEDYPVADAIASKLLAMAEDSAWYRSRRKDRRRKSGSVHATSFFDAHAQLEEGSVDLLVTSPPYLNNYHYNRNTRPQLYWLGFCACPNDMKALEELNFGSYWQNARVRATVELDRSIQSSELRRTLATIRQRNPDRGVYGGNVEGPGIYALFYAGDLDFYGTITNSQHPIYVGKAVPPGSRKGGEPDVTKPAIFNRLKNHSKSIVAVNTLDLAHFQYQSLAIEPVWITLAERFLVDNYKPVWNVCLDGFGKNDPGAARIGERSWWDTLHPGRPWAEREQAGTKTRDAAETKVRDFLASQAAP